MKVTALITIVGHYVDGANIANYNYQVATKTFTFLAKNLWQLRAFSLLLATANKSIVAFNHTVVGGAPPAPATRSITITPAGLITWTDVKETLSTVMMTLTISDCEDHPYETISMSIPNQEMVGTFTLYNGAAVSLSEDEWVSQDTFIADGAATQAIIALTGTGITDSKVKPFSVCIAETDLVLREYTGQYAELAMKGIVSAAQVVGGHYEGLAAQVANYFASGSSPMALELMLNEHTLRIGEGI